MGFPESNLPSLDGQRHYMMVQKATDDPASLAYNRCMANDTAEYRGFALSIVYEEKGNILAKVKYYTYAIDDTDSEYKYETIQTIEDNVQDTTAFLGEASSGQQAVQTALYYAFSPAQRMESIHELLNLEYMPLLESKDADQFPLAHSRTKLIRHMFCATDVLSKKSVDKRQCKFHKYNNKFNDIDRQHVQLLLTSVNASSIIDVNPYIHSAHVNIVHNCEQVCSQAVLSEAHSFITTQDIQHYGLLCTHRLLEVNAIQEQRRTQTTEQTINSTVNNTDINSATINVMSSMHDMGCNECDVYNMLPVIVSVMFATCSAVSIFVKRSNNRCARAMRSCFSQIMCATNGVYRMQRDTAVQTEEIYNKYINHISFPITIARRRSC